MALAALLTLFTAASMRGGTITVVNLPATNTDIATGITTNQNYVCAFDYGSLDANTYTVNGVPFAHFKIAANNVIAVTNWVDPFHGGQVIVSANGPAANKINATSSATQGGTSGPVANQADGVMRSILTDLMFEGGVGAPGAWIQQEFDNLTPGGSYALRIYYRQWSSNRQVNILFNGEGSWQPYSGNPLDLDAGGAHYIEYDFVALSTNVFCVMTNLVTGNSAMAYAATVADNSISVATLPATNTDIATGIFPGKHYLCAFDGGTGSTVPTINGVPFTKFDPGQNVGFTASLTDPNFGGTLTLNCGGPGGNNMLGRTSSTGQGNLAGQADGSMFTLLTDLIYVTGAAPTNSWLQQEYDGLTTGDQYSLRIYYRYWGNAVGDRLQNVYVNGQGTWQPYPANPLDEDAGGARYLQYNFKATSGSVFMVMTNLIANGSMMVYGVTLEDDSYPFAPFITYQPSVLSTNGGTLATFNMAAIGTAPLAYQWYMNTSSNYAGATVLAEGNGVSGSTSPSLRITTNVLNYYFVVVTNNYGSATSAIAQVYPAPVIVTQASAAKVGTNVVYSATAIGFQPLSYQWYFNTVSNYSGAVALVDGGGVSGSTTTNLTNSINLQDYYFVVVTNIYGSITSAVTAYYPFPAIVTQPAPFRAGSAVGFNVTASGWPTLGYQWYLNTVSNYDGATRMTDSGGVSGSTTTNVTIANLLDYYFVVVTNFYGSVTSLVTQVAAPLTVAAAGEPIWIQTTQTNVLVAFSDLLDPATATNRANYSLDNGASIVSAALVASNEVLLATSVLNPSTSYTLTVRNVLDYFGILQTPSPTNLAVGTYPANLALWVKASSGVTTNPDGTVTQWNDLSGNGNNLLDAFIYAFNDPLLTNNASGDPVVRFDSTNGMYGTALYANDAPSLQITGDMSVVAVVSFPEAAFGGGHGEIVAKTGTANPNIPAPYDYRAASTGLTTLRGNGNSVAGSYGTATVLSSISSGNPHVLVFSGTGNVVNDYVDGQFSGSVVLGANGGGIYNMANCADLGQPFFVGGRGDSVKFNAEKLTGDLAELIVAGSALTSYDVATLAAYLVKVHHIVNTTPTKIVYSVSANQLTLSWPVNYTGWRLQGQTNSPGVGIKTNWSDVPGSALVNQVTIPIGPTNGSVFYRMVYP
jgi:hypothetical protein